MNVIDSFQPHLPLSARSYETSRNLSRFADGDYRADITPEKRIPMWVQRRNEGLLRAKDLTA